MIAPSDDTPSSLAALTPIRVVPTDPAVTVATFGTGTWDAQQLREPGGVTYDPATSLWVCVWTGQNSSNQEFLGIATSTDAETWTAGANPISGATQGEDPYIVKTFDGEVYRDDAGLAYMYCEEKTGIGNDQRGIDLWRSGADVLTGWTHEGRVIDRAASGFGSLDRTSPTVIYDGTQFVMLFEGRASGNEGEVGYATSTDGLSWAVDADPIITRGTSGTWSDVSIVPDDLIKVGSTWILLGHASGGIGYQAGRWSTIDAPADWDATSFTEMSGNPIAPGMWPQLQCWGNDPEVVVYQVEADSLHKATIVEHHS